MKFFTKEVKIALTAIAAIVILFYGLQFLKGLNIFSNDDAYYVTFSDVSGLSASSPVYANGYKVGVVKEIRYDYSPKRDIVAVMGLDKRLRLPVGSRAEIASDLLGNIRINLVLGDDPVNMVAKGDTIAGGEEKGMMSKVGEMMPTVESMLPKLDSIMGSLNALLADPALAAILHHVETTTANLSTTSRELQTLSARLNHDVPTLVQRTNGVMANTEKVTADLAAIDVKAMAESVNPTLASVEEMTRRLNSNEGTLGLLMRDASLYNNLNATAADADSLLIDLKAHPKRYVNISVFGKKEK